MIRIVTDSTAGLSKKVAREQGIAIVPLRVIFPEETYKDGVDISPSEFYVKLPQSRTLPTTSQPPAGEFEEVFEPIIDNGDEVLTITISSKLSGTFASAISAQKTINPSKITVFDSLTTAAPLKFMAMWAARQAQAGKTVAEILDGLQILRDRAPLLFTVQTFEYLQKGGRIGGAAALAVSLLNIKPILTLNNGIVDASGKVRGKKKALQTMVQAVHERVGSGPHVQVEVLHGRAEEEAEAYADEVEKVIGCPRPEISEFSPVLGVHVGPGAIGIGAYNETWL